MVISTQDIIKILVAILLGGLIGIERETREKSAGFRTIILICLGSAVFSMLSTYMSSSDDPTRIAAGIVTGIGFLGAGSILRVKDHISGLTTAATIWLSAGIGLAVGAGNYGVAAAVTVIALAVLWVFPVLENLISNLRTVMTYNIVCTADMEVLDEIEAEFDKHGLKFDRRKSTKADKKISTEYEVFGQPSAHESLIDALLQSDDVIELSY